MYYLHLLRLGVWLLINPSFTESSGGEYGTIDTLDDIIV